MTTLHTPAHAPNALPRKARRGAARGFTMVELLVAMAAGLTVASAAFILSKNATTFFQHEARVSGAQLAATFGMTRISADLQRASFMSSPNVQKDPFRCGDMSDWPDSLKKLAGVRITEGGSVTDNPGQLDQSVDPANEFDPDSIVISGSFNTTEQFPVRTVVPGNGGVSVYLQTDSGPYVRMLASEEKGGEPIEDIFAAGRFLRLVDAEGRHEYGVISGVDQQNGQVIIQLDDSVAIPQKSPATTCGYSGLAIGILANPISRVRYELRSLAGDPSFGGITAPVANAVTGDDKRTELVRTELDAEGNAIGTELVAEYAVDLKFGITVASAGQNPTLTRYPIAKPTDGNVYGVADDVTNGGTPERIRAVQVRISTRSRAPDREIDLAAGASDGRKARFFIPGVPKPAFARMRTLYADIALPNQAGVTW